MDKYKNTRTDALVVMLDEIARELAHGRALNQIQLEMVAGISAITKALNYSVNG